MKTFIRSLKALFVLSLSFLLVSCNDSGGGGGSGSDVTSILCIGDSITRGFGVTTPYPSVLAGISGKPVSNQGRDGDTSAQGLSRISSAIARSNPSHVCIMFGANDIILATGLPNAAANIGRMIDVAKAAGVEVVVGQVTPFTGSREFLNAEALKLNEAIADEASARGVRVAKTHSAVGINVNSDGTHPNQEGANAIAGAFDSRL